MDIEKRVTTLMGRPLKLCIMGCDSPAETGMASVGVIRHSLPSTEEDPLKRQIGSCGRNVTTAANLSRFQQVAARQRQPDPSFTLTEESENSGRWAGTLLLFLLSNSI